MKNAGLLRRVVVAIHTYWGIFLQGIEALPCIVDICYPTEILSVVHRPRSRGRPQVHP